jgi:hypothetical protein
MIHDAWGMSVGNEEDTHKYADLLGRTSQNLAKIYETKAGGTADEWRALMRTETWFVGAEAVDAGLIDAVADADTAKQDVAAAWDLSVYAKAPPRGDRPVRPAASHPIPTDVSPAAGPEFTDADVAAFRDAMRGALR